MVRSAQVRSRPFRTKLMEMEMTAYADDLALLVATKEVGRLVEAANESVERVIGWMDEQGMALAAEKTGIVVKAGRRKLKSVEIRVKGCAVQSGEAIKYLGVWIDKDLKMVQHVKKNSRKSR